jgi:3-oxoacyl-[acyl-carrier-protein] synthase-3
LNYKKGDVLATVPTPAAKLANELNSSGRTGMANTLSTPNPNDSSGASENSSAHHSSSVNPPHGLKVAARPTRNPGDPPKSESVRHRLINYQPSGRSRLNRLMGIKIAATGSFVPERVVPNEELAALGCDSDWIVQRTGIKQRHHANPDVATSDLAIAAAQDCLARANLNASEVDLILVATITPDQLTPSTACLVQDKLGCVCPAMDVNAACAGFMYALITAAQFVKAGTARNALVIGAEVMSRTVNPADIKTYPLFGDGAGAVLVQPSDDPQQGFASYTLGAEGVGATALCIPGGGSREPLSAEGLNAGRQFLAMDGRTVFKWAVRVIEDSTIDVLGFAGWKPSDLQCVILHQANLRIIDSAVEDFEFERDRLLINVDRYGNTSAASIPLALDEAVKTGRVQRGDKLLLSGFGSGLAWGTAAVCW